PPAGLADALALLPSAEVVSPPLLSPQPASRPPASSRATINLLLFTQYSFHPAPGPSAVGQPAACRQTCRTHTSPATPAPPRTGNGAPLSLAAGGHRS